MLPIFQPKSNSIITASNFVPLSRTSSIGPENQGQENSCFAYTAARIITRCITQIIPNKFKLTPDEESLLYDRGFFKIFAKDYKNCFVYDSVDLESVRKVLSFNKCRIPKRYNHMIVFYYTLFTIKKKYGCNFGSSYNVLKEFTTSPQVFYYIKNDSDCSSKYIFSTEIDDVAKNLIQEYVNFICTNQIRVETNSITLPLNINKGPHENWITKFPEGAKNSLKNKMYVGFNFHMPESQWQTINAKNILNPSSYTSECLGNITGHTVVITKWEPGYITILNSWGTGWGNRGYVRLPSENFYKFVLSPNCKAFNNPTSSMYFVYLTFEKKQNGEPYDLNTISDRSGGKRKNTKKLKTKKLKTKNNKSKKMRQTK